MRPSASRRLRRYALLASIALLPGCTADRLIGPGPAVTPQMRQEITAVAGRHEGEEGRLQAIEMFRGDLAWLESRLQAGQGDRRDLEARITRTRERIRGLMASASAELAADSIDEPVAGEAVRILTAETEVAIWDAGQSSTGRVYAHTHTDQYANIQHKIGYSVSVNGRALPRITQEDESFLLKKFLGTPISLSGLNCELRTAVEAQTQHTADNVVSPKALASSIGSDDCGPAPKALCGDEPVDHEAVSSGDVAVTATDCVGGAAGGGESSCRLILITVHVSYDNGATWFLQSQEIVEICDF